MALTWTREWEEIRMFGIEYGTADAGHGRYNWVEGKNGSEILLYYKSKGFLGMPPAPTGFKKAKGGKHLGTFGSPDEAEAAAEEHHESKLA